MRITYQLDHTYNDRRYSRPWIALITAWPVGESPTLSFGQSIDKLCAEIDAPEGALIKYGQKDYRNARNVNNNFAVVCENGEKKDLTAAEAREYWINHHTPAAGCYDGYSDTEAARRLAMIVSKTV